MYSGFDRNKRQDCLDLQKQIRSGLQQAGLNDVRVSVAPTAAGSMKAAVNITRTSRPGFEAALDDLFRY